MNERLENSVAGRWVAKDSRRMLVKSEGLRDLLRRARRELTAKMVSKLVGSSMEGERGGGQTSLPEKSKRAEEAIRQQIREQGVVGGLASKIKDAADGYIDAKLDEIEQRIDLKLDEIDRRLTEWRDQEIVNRLRIIRITLLGSIAVAVVSLVYTYIKYHM